MRRQGPRTSNGDPHRLDPDGWLVRSQTDTLINESPAAEKGRQVISKTVKQVSGSSGPRPGSCCPLDTRLLMGGNLGERIWRRGAPKPGDRTEHTFIVVQPGACIRAFNRGGMCGRKGCATKAPTGSF